jgi:hypothetical protein
MSRVFSDNPYLATRFKQSTAVDTEQSPIAVTTETLIDDFFTQTGREPILFLDAGTGRFPHEPKRTGKPAPNGTIVIYIPTPDGLKEKRSTRYERAWQACELEYFLRVKREVCKAHAEMGKGEVLYARQFDSVDDARRFVNARQKAIKRARAKGEDAPSLVYQLYPFIPDDGSQGQTAVICNYPGGREVPTDRSDAYALFEPLVNTTPEEELKRHSQGYGQHWQGMRGDGRLRLIEKETGVKLTAFQIVTSKSEGELSEKLPTPKHGFIPLEEISAYQEALRAAAGDWQVRGGGSVDLAFHRMRQACTLLANTEERGNLYAQVGDMVSEEEGIGEKKLSQPGLFDANLPAKPTPTNGIEPIYLDGRWIQ